MFLTLDDCVDRSCVCQLSLDEYMMMMTFRAHTERQSNYSLVSS